VPEMVGWRWSAQRRVERLTRLKPSVNVTDPATVLVTAISVLPIGAGSAREAEDRIVVQASHPQLDDVTHAQPFAARARASTTRQLASSPRR
jgi:hypothetical protein